MMPSWDDAVKWHQANVVSFELMLDVVVEVDNGFDIELFQLGKSRSNILG
jgi:hypothetical protein